MSGVVLLALLGLGTACGEQEQMDGDFATAPLPAIWDGAHDGREDFYFLPPLVSDPGVDPELPRDLELLDELVIEICELELHECIGDPIATLTSQGPGSEAIRVSGDHFNAALHTREYPFEEGDLYRVSVFVGPTLYGYIDLVVIARGGQARSVDDAELFALLGGRTLPIKFLILSLDTPAPCCDPALEPGTGGNLPCAHGASCCDDGTWACNQSDGTPSCANLGNECPSCCDPALEPGTGENPPCTHGATCCADGTWQCNQEEGVPNCAVCDF